ncbi:hypothetical protein [Pseudonocardia acaciae]|uniref:hypothetical protein n=1 Tax=Pseudonocardia acaciae TaxID=551276 RepID=UPI000AF8D152|nr:hypothetical protein [Pseudonocardia acaciae]
MVRAFGSVAAVVAAALAIVIGVLAYNANSHQHDERARIPGGGQAGAPLELRAVGGIPMQQPPELVNSGGLGSAPGPRAAPAAPNAPARATFSGGGGGARAATPPAPRACSPGLLGGLVSLVGGLLGGGGGGC